MYVDRTIFSQQRSALLARLQDMPFLRHVEGEMWLPGPPFSSQVPGGVRRLAVLLSKLTSLQIIIHCIPVDALIPELSTPSLQEFYVSLHHRSRTFHNPHLSDFARGTGIISYTAPSNHVVSPGPLARREGETVGPPPETSSPCGTPFRNPCDICVTGPCIWVLMMSPSAAFPQGTVAIVQLYAKMVSASLVPGDRVWFGHRFYSTGDLLGRRRILVIELQLPFLVTFRARYTGLRRLVESQADCAGRFTFTMSTDCES